MPGPPNFFVDHKRGEVNELKAILRNPKVLRDSKKTLEVIKKVIAYMTLGIDVSRVFSEMIMCANTKNLVQKKMVYHYLCSYAKQKADLALLAVNTLQQDCADEDPMVRGLALRSLCSLKLTNLVEYIITPIRERLKDSSPYVRKTAVVGVAKLYQLSPQDVTSSDLVDVLYEMLRDRDPQVIANVIQALNEILASEGGMAINSMIVSHLLNMIRQFNEWGQCIVLDLVAGYTPQNDQEMFAIMNLLETRLKHSNSAVVMATTKIFLNFTRDNPQLHEQVYQRLKAPLLTLMSTGTDELTYAVLAHVDLLVGQASGVFNDSFKHFYLRYSDPPCVKMQKLAILTQLADEKNCSEILDELAEYVSDVDQNIARASIKGIAQLALKIESSADDAVEHLLGFLDLNTDYICAQTCIAIKDLLRKYPERDEEVIPTLQDYLRSVEEESGRVAVIWLLGEYGEIISDAPYVLEGLIDTFNEEPSNAVRMELLTATMKLFFKRPPEVQQMMGRLLKEAIEDVTKVDVRDRALLYYRLLQLDVHEAARVINCPKVTVDVFAESKDTELKEKIFKEFNSLSVVYGIPAERFVVKELDLGEEDEEDQTQQGAGASLTQNADKSSVDTNANSAHAQMEAKGTESGSGDPSVGSVDSQSPASFEIPNFIDDNKTNSPSSSSSSSSSVYDPTSFTSTTPSNATSSSSPPSNDIASLLDFDTPSTSSTTTTTTQQTPSLTLDPQAKVNPQEFQAKWGSLTKLHSLELKLSTVQLAQQISAAWKSISVIMMASGTVQQTMKFYFFARGVGDPNSSPLFLLECLVNLTTGVADITLKTENSDPASTEEFIRKLGTAFP